MDDINALATPSNRLTEYDHKRMLFEAHVHKHSNQNLPIGTIYEELNKHQKRLVLGLLKFSDKLNVRQMAYLQYAIRDRVNALYPNWRNLHWNPDSLYRKEFLVMPTAASLQHLNEMKIMPKKKVTSTIIGSRKKAA